MCSGQMPFPTIQLRNEPKDGYAATRTHAPREHAGWLGRGGALVVPQDRRNYIINFIKHILVNLPGLRRPMDLGAL